jgi:hypothetical protein
MSCNRAIGTALFILELGYIPLFEIDRKLGKSKIIVPRTQLVNDRKIRIDKYSEEIIKGTVGVKNN